MLFSNAGICPFHEFLDMPNDLWKRVQAVNLDGSFYITKAVANQMVAQTPQGGAIVAISSISALVGGAQQTHYTPTKAGIKVRRRARNSLSDDLQCPSTLSP